jgi:hypothetical protein
VILHHSFLQPFPQLLIILPQSVKFILFALDGFLKPVHVGLLLRAKSLLRVTVLLTPFLSELGFQLDLLLESDVEKSVRTSLTSLRISSPAEVDEMGLLTPGATGLGWLKICIEGGGMSSKSPHDSVGGDANRFGEFKCGCARHKPLLQAWGFEIR